MTIPFKNIFETYLVDFAVAFPKSKKGSILMLIVVENLSGLLIAATTKN